MNHPEQIVRTLDRHLTRPVRLILYGRAALALGYPSPLADFHATMDVDAILPEVEMTLIEADDSFWNAIEMTNAELEPSGLYLTHLFTDAQVILRPDWLDHLVPIPLTGLRYLELARPATADLILTKMMRVDPQDRSDLRFLVEQSSFDGDSLEVVASSARIPDLPEIRDAFERNLEWLKEHLRSDGR